MSKFYAQSGSLAWTVEAVDAEGAALGLLHQALRPFLPKGEIVSSCQHEEAVVRLLGGLAQLAPAIRVSEIGIGRCEAGQFDTGQLFQTWQQLSRSVVSLLDTFH